MADRLPFRIARSARRAAGSGLRKLLPDPRLLVCMLLGAIVYFPTLKGEFVWDDVLFVERWVGSTDTLWEILFPAPAVIGTAFYYRPITQGFATLLWALFGEEAPYWHASIILIHVVTIGLVYRLLKEWWLAGEESARKRDWAAIAGAGFYAVWPANAESIAWISSRADTLLGPFLLGALLLHLRSRDRGRRPVGAALMFLCSLLVKETGIVFLPLAVAATVLLPRGASEPPADPGKPVFKPWASALWLPHLLVYFVYSLMRKFSMGAGVSISELAMDMVRNTDPGRIFGAWGFYVQEALVLGPAPPFLRHPPPPGDVAPYAVLGLLAFAACCVFLLRAKTRPLALTGAWFVLPLGPPLAAVSMPLSQNAVTIHYLYIPNVALAALVGFALLWVLRQPRFAPTLARAFKPAIAVAFALVAGCALVSYRHYQPWMSGRALWWRGIQDNPLSCIAQQNYAIAAWLTDDPETAVRHLRFAAYACEPADSPERHGALIALSQFYTTRREWAKARKALRDAQDLAGSIVMLGRRLEIESAILVFEKMDASAADGPVTLKREDLRRPIAVLEDATRIDPYGTESRITLATLYSAAGERPRALQTYREIRRIASNDNMRRLAARQIEKLEKEMAAETDPMRRAYERGQIADVEGRFTEALSGYEEALRLEPGRADILLALADVHARTRDFPAAIARAGEATMAEPESAIAWLNLGVYHADARDFPAAEKAFDRARGLAPKWPKACLNHGRALQILGRRTDAAAVYRTCLEEVPSNDLDARRDLEIALQGTEIVPPTATDKKGLFEP